MNKISDKRKISKMMIVFMAVYMVSYLTRIDFEGLISEIVRAEGLEKSLVSICVTCLFITYGIGQLFSGYLGEKIQPKRLISCGLLTSAAMNVLVTVCSSPYQMAVVWGVNGLAQAFMWPPLVKLMTELFDEETYKTAVVRVSWGSSMGTAAIYVLGPLFISLFSSTYLFGKSMGWRSAFVFCALLAVIMAVLVAKVCPEIEKTLPPVSSDSEGNERAKTKIPFFVFFIMLAIVLQGMLRDGVTTWTPSLISEVFSLPTEHSILTGVFLPLFGMFAFWIVGLINRKEKFKNELYLSALIFSLGAVAAALLALFNGKNPALSIGLSALLTGCMHGVNLLLVCVVPARFKKYGNVSFMSGLLNFCTYVGSASATYAIAKIAEKYNWSVTIMIWCVIASLGAIVCFTQIGRWKKFCSDE